MRCQVSSLVLQACVGPCTGQCSIQAPAAAACCRRSFGESKVGLLPHAATQDFDLACHAAAGRRTRPGKAGERTPLQLYCNQNIFCPLP